MKLNLLYVVVGIPDANGTTHELQMDFDDLPILEELDFRYFYSETPAKDKRYWQLGDPEMVAKLILSNLRGKPVTHVKFADGNPCNLRRSNLR